MGSFKDLPKDVIWRIFQEVIRQSLDTDYWHVLPKNPNKLRMTHFEFPGRLEWSLGLKMERLALISKQTLALIKSKCHKSDDKLFGWTFNTGILKTLYGVF
jgi:hypothetical protein